MPPPAGDLVRHTVGMSGPRLLLLAVCLLAFGRIVYVLAEDSPFDAVLAVAGTVIGVIFVIRYLREQRQG